MRRTLRRKLFAVPSSKMFSSYKIISFFFSQARSFVLSFEKPFQKVTEMFQLLSSWFFSLVCCLFLFSFYSVTWIHCQSITFCILKKKVYFVNSKGPTWGQKFLEPLEEQSIHYCNLSRLCASTYFLLLLLAFTVNF
jgi:hypothetical protein